jgi:predicted NBD/HSP70 family sugar kinase
LTVRDLFDWIVDDDDARRAINETTRLLALAIVSVASTIDPQIVASAETLADA